MHWIDTRLNSDQPGVRLDLNGTRSAAVIDRHPVRTPNGTAESDLFASHVSCNFAEYIYIYFVILFAESEFQIQMLLILQNKESRDQRSEMVCLVRNGFTSRVEVW